VLCHDLRERALVGWTAAELARTLTARGDVVGADALLDDQAVRAADGEAGLASALLVAEAVVSLAEGDPDRARARSQAAWEAERKLGAPNPTAALAWWMGALFGEEAVGGGSVLAEAKEQLQRNGWQQALAEPRLLPDPS